MLSLWTVSGVPVQLAVSTFTGSHDHDRLTKENYYHLQWMSLAPARPPPPPPPAPGGGDVVVGRVSEM